MSDDLEVRLQRSAAIAGSVADEFGRPLSSVPVMAGHRGMTDGETRFEPSAIAETDDIGRYRIHGLPAGEYIVGRAQVRLPGIPIRPLSASGDDLKGFYPDATGM